MTTEFSFIIPHKNTPDLLQKCLDSIPRRDDVQIIVVDDNSDAERVDFMNFPGLNDPSVEVYLTKEGRGAGFARNVGLDHAVGKWLIFADADDYFTNEISFALDAFSDADADVVFFKGHSEKLSDGSRSMRGEELNRRVDIALRTGNFVQVLLYSCPWRKFFRRSLVEEHKIRFNEVRWGNDVVFFANVARCSSKYLASPLDIYCTTESDSSLVKVKNIESQVVRLKEECLEVRLLRRKFRHEESLHYWLLIRWLGVYKLNRLVGLRELPNVIFSSGWNFIKQSIKVKFRNQ